MEPNTITICACSSRSFISNDKVISIVSALKNNGYKVNIIDDLCRMVADEPEKAKQLAKGTIIACYARAVTSSFDAMSIDSSNILNMRSSSVQEILDNWQIVEVPDTKAPLYNEIKKEIESLPVADGKDAWYPVIDKSRCTNCGKCHDFCLFGVYTKKNDEIVVVQPHNCKNNCPACARMCPSRAIIFPKYEKSPINGGIEIEEEFSDEDKEAMYQKRLEYRLQQNRSRFSILKQDRS
jgi:NAD-dependent dihydropyrimidine dehydrogenase PreA subunit